MEDKKLNHQNHISNTTYVLVWLGLLALTSLTVTVAGINLGAYTLFVAMAIAAVKVFLVSSIFMHLKFSDPIFKIFVSIVILTLAVIFILTFLDYFYR